MEPDNKKQPPLSPEKSDHTIGSRPTAAASGLIAEEEHLSFMQDLRRRLRAVKTSRWIRFAIVSLLFCGFVVWLGNPWVALLWLLLLDIYITAYIPWTWWKKSGNKTLRAVMAWVDAIVYALVLVYVIFAFVGRITRFLHHRSKSRFLWAISYG